MSYYKRCYLPYPRGEDPNRLRIGDLVLDPFNPVTGKSTARFKFMKSKSQEEYWEVVKKWAPNPQKEALWSCEFHAAKGWLNAARVAEAFTAKMGKDDRLDTIIEGEFGRRFEVEENVDFLLDVVMQDPGAETWVQKQLSSSWYMKFFNKRRGQTTHTPKVWVCTGLQLVGGAHARTKSETAREFTWGATLNSGMITNGVPGGPDIISLETSHTKTSGGETSYYHDDERIWAALFFPLEIDYIRPGTSGTEKSNLVGEKEKEHKHKIPKVIGLEELEDLGSSAIRDNETRIREDDGALLDDRDDGKRAAVITGLSTMDDHVEASTDPNAVEKASKPDKILIDETYYAREMDKVSDTELKEFNRYGNWFDSLNDYSNSQ